MKNHPPNRQPLLDMVALIARLVLLAMVIVTPWFFGGILIQTQVWLFVGALVGVVCWLIQCLVSRRFGVVLPLVFAPLVLCLGLGAFQLLPLDAAIYRALAPGGAQLRDALLSKELSSNSIQAEEAGVPSVGPNRTISMYPASTRSQLALFVLAVTMFLLGAVYFVDRRAQKWLCWLLAANGMAITIFGLVQKIRWNGLLYWNIPLTQSGVPFGPYVNRNNAGGYLNLCLACALGIAVYAIIKGQSSNGSELNSSSRSSLSFFARFQESLANLNVAMLSAIGLTGFVAAGVFCTLSRGAMIAMMVATLLTLLVVFIVRRQHIYLGWLVLTAVVGFALIGWMGMGEKVKDRLATLTETSLLEKHGLVPHWKDALEVVPDSPYVGSGFGAYRYVYRPYQKKYSPRWFYFAENQYLESLVEGGVIALGLMLSIIGLVGVAAWRLLRHAVTLESFAFSIVCIFAVISQAIASFFDFGMHLPANMLLFALLCGAVSAQAAELNRLHSTGWFQKICSNFRLTFLRLPLSIVFLILVFAVCFWGFQETRSAASAERVLRETRYPHTPTGASTETLKKAILQIDTVLAQRPDDAEVHQRMVELQIHLYRVQALSQLCRELGFEGKRERLWRVTSPIALHAGIYRFLKSDLPSELHKLKNEPVVQQHLVPALRHSILASRCCPLLPRMQLMMAQLCVLEEGEPNDITHIDQTRLLAPADEDLAYRCGLLDYNAGRTVRAYASWKQSLTIHSPAHLSDILQLVGPRLGERSVIEKLLPDSPSFLFNLAEKQYRQKQHTRIRQMLLKRAEKLIANDNLPEEEQCYLLGSIHALMGSYSLAVEDFSRAVKLRPLDIEWRYQLAMALFNQGDLEGARTHARWCARTDTRNSSYRKLLERINEAHLRLPTTSE